MFRKIFFPHPARIAAWVLFACALPMAGATAPRVADDAASLRAVVATERARPRAPRFERDAFLAQAVLRGAVLSPEGRSVVAFADDGRDRSLWQASAGEPAGHRLLARTDAQSLAFSHDDRWLFLAAPTQVRALAMAGQPGSGTIAQVGGRTHREFFGVDPWQPAAVLLLERPPVPSMAPKRWRLLRVDAGGRQTVLHAGNHPVVDAATAPDGSLAWLLLAVGDSHVVVHQDTPGHWRAAARCLGARRCVFVGTADAGRDLLLRTNLDSDRMALVRLDAAGHRRTLHVDPRGEADLDDVVMDPRTNTPLVATYRGTVVGNYGLDPATRARVAAIQARFPDAMLRLEAGSGSDAPWLVHERGGALRGERLHLFDAHAARSVELFGQWQFQVDGKPLPRLPETALARQLPIAWTASDGLRLYGFLWLPPGVDTAHAPLVVSVHGGPFNQVGPDYSNSAQFLANRGYVVFAPNFRSSTGYGRRIVIGGHGDFGGDGRVQRDIVEGTRWLLAHGIGDAGRVGIVGASFGGYSTLLGLTFQPELFKVGIAAVPPSDFAWVIREYLGSGVELSPGVPMAASMRLLGVDPDDRALMARLHAGSPTANAARMARPLLVMAGGEDERVPIRGVTDYAARLRTLGKDVTLFVDADGGHSNADPRTHEAYLYLQEALLHRALGGAAPSPPGGALRDHLRRNLRLVGPSLVEDVRTAGISRPVGAPAR